MAVVVKVTEEPGQFVWLAMAEAMVPVPLMLMTATALVTEPTPLVTTTV